MFFVGCDETLATGTRPCINVLHGSTRRDVCFPRRAGRDGRDGRHPETRLPSTLPYPNAKRAEDRIDHQMMVMEPPLREICSRKIRDTATAYVPETAPKGS